MRFDYTHPALMSVHGIPVPLDEPHAQVGNHVRVSTHPLLGLPIAPFIFDVAMTDYEELATRSSVVFSRRNPSRRTWAATATTTSSTPTGAAGETMPSARA